LFQHPPRLGWAISRREQQRSIYGVSQCHEYCKVRATNCFLNAISRREQQRSIYGV